MTFSPPVYKTPCNVEFFVIYVFFSSFFFLLSSFLFFFALFVHLVIDLLALLSVGAVAADTLLEEPQLASKHARAGHAGHLGGPEAVRKLEQHLDNVACLQSAGRREPDSIVPEKKRKKEKKKQE